MAIANAVNAQTAGYQSLTSAGVWNGRTFQAGTGISLTNADGTAGNTTIAATGAVGGSGTVVVFDDFLGSMIVVGPPSGFSGNFGWTQSSGTGYPIAYSTPETGRPGVVHIECDSNGAEDGSLMTGDLSGTCRGMVLGGGACVYSTWVKLDTLGIVGEDYNCYIGMGNLSDAGTEVTNGVYFHYTRLVNSAQWVGKTAAAAARNSVNSVIAASTNWVKLGFTINAAATSVEFFINNASIGTQTLTIPSTEIGWYYQMDNISGGTNKLLHVDLIDFVQTLTTPRT